MTEENHEVRELRFRVKQLGRQNGHQGETIHRLRAELAEVRELHSRIERGQLRALELLLTAERAHSARLVKRYNIVFANNLELREKLAATENATAQS